MSSRGRFLAALGAGMGATRLPALAQTAPLPVLRVGMSLTDGVTPVLYGMQTGMFRDAGVDVKLVAGNNGAALASALAGGALDVAASSLMSILTGFVRGVPLRIVAGSSIYSPAVPTSEVCVLSTSRFRTFADLAGATIALSSARSLDELGIRALVDKSGAASTSLKFIETPGTLMAEALKQGRADAASVSEPNLARALDNAPLRTLGDPYAGIANGIMIAAFFANPAYVTQNRKTIEAFTRALYKASAYTNTHTAETVQLLADYAKMEPDLVRKMARLTNATSLDLRMLQPSIDMAAKYKVIDHGFSAKDLIV